MQFTTTSFASVALLAVRATAQWSEAAEYSAEVVPFVSSAAEEATSVVASIASVITDPAEDATPVVESVVSVVSSAAADATAAATSYEEEWVTPVSSYVSSVASSWASYPTIVTSTKANGTYEEHAPWTPTNTTDPYGSDVPVVTGTDYQNGAAGLVPASVMAVVAVGGALLVL